MTRQVLAAGDTVFAAARSPSGSVGLQELAASTPSDRLHLIELDTSDAESIKRAGTNVEELLAGRGLDYLINNAAKVSRQEADMGQTLTIYQGGNDLPSTIDPDEFMEFMRINVLGPALVYQAFLPALERSKRPEGPVVMNTTSGLGSIGLDCGVKNASYSISKCALQMLVSLLKNFYFTFG